MCLFVIYTYSIRQVDIKVKWFGDIFLFFLYNILLRVEIGFLYLEGGSELEQTRWRLYALAVYRIHRQDFPKTIFKN